MMRSRFLAVVVLAAASVLAVAAPASAHNYLVSSTPAANATLTSLPKSFGITTNEGLLDLTGQGSGFAFDVQDSQGRYYGDGCIQVKGASMTVKPALGAAGDYRVTWQVVSADSHTVSGQYRFRWEPAAGASPSASHATAPNCGGKSGGHPAAAQPAAPAGPQNANLADVLWIGGAVLALIIAIPVTLVVLSRTRRDARS